VTERKALATYHFLGALSFFSPVLGMAAIAIFRLRHKIPSEAEEIHFCEVMNFQISLLLLMLAPYLFFPSVVGFIISTFISLIGTGVLIQNGRLVLKGQTFGYPFVVNYIRPPRKQISVEEMMFRAREESGEGASPSFPVNEEQEAPKQKKKKKNK
jgi:hypothetical protein